MALRRLLAGTALVLAPLLTPSAGADPVRATVTFGDSLSDNGNIPELSGRRPDVDALYIVWGGANDYFTLGKILEQTPPARRAVLAEATDPCIRDLRCPLDDDEQEEYLFWDASHPTTAAHAILAAYAANVLNAPRTVTVSGRLTALTVTEFQSALADRLAAVRGGVRGAEVSGSLFDEDERGRPVEVADALAERLTDLGMTSGIGLSRRTPSEGLEHPLALFVNARFGFGDRDGGADEVAFDYRHTLVTAGADYRVSDHVVVGAALGYGFGGADLEDEAGAIDQENVLAAFYAEVFTDDWYLDATAGVSLDRTITRRATGFPGLIAKGRPHGRTWSLSLEAGYVFHYGLGTGELEFGPTLGARYADITIDRYTERGAAGLDMTVGRQRTQSLVGRLGFQAGYTVETETLAITPRAWVTWEHAFADRGRTLRTSLADPPLLILSTRTPEPPRDVVTAGVGFGIEVNERFSAEIEYETAISRRDGSDHTITGRLRLAF